MRIKYFIFSNIVLKSITALVLGVGLWLVLTATILQTCIDSAGAAGPCVIPAAAPTISPANNYGTTDTTPQLLATSAAGAPALPDEADWYNASWLYRKKVIIDNTKVNANLTNFPVYVTRASDANLASYAQDDGDDILFVNSSNTKLDHELISFNGTTGELHAWVEATSLADTTNTNIYMYYGNGAAAAQQNKTGTWSNGYSGVWHMEEAAGNIADSTSNGWVGTNVQTVTIAGKVKSGRNFDGIDDGINVNVPNASFNWASNYTVSMWVKFDRLGDPLSACNEPKNNTLWTIYDDYWHDAISQQLPVAWGYANHSHRKSDGTGGYSVRSLTNTTATWYYIANVHDDSGNFLRFYRNGVNSYNTSTSTSVMADFVSNTVKLGYYDVNCGGDWTDGIIDEFRISPTVRSTGWLSTEYNNQNSPLTFYTVNPQLVPSDLGGDSCTNTVHEFEVDSVSSGDIAINGLGTSTYTPTLAIGTHTWKARTKNEIGAGPWSATRNLYVISAPSSLTVNAAGRTTANVSWTPGNGPGYGQQASYREKGTSTWTDLTPNNLPGGQANTHQFQALAPNKTWEWRVIGSYSCCSNQIAYGPDFTTVGITSYTIQKTLLSPDPSRTGEVVNFLVTITNTGDNTLTTLPLTDTYDPSVFLFWDTTTPYPSTVNEFTGVLNWNNLGPLTAGNSVNVTVALGARYPTEPDSTTNTATVNGAIDQFSNPVPQQSDDASVKISEAYKWLQVIDGDIFSNSSISLEVPIGKHALLKSNSNAGGMPVAFGNINYAPGGLSERGWKVSNYGSTIGFPAFDTATMKASAIWLPAGWNPESNPIDFVNGSIYYYDYGDLSFPDGYTIEDTSLQSGESATILVNGNLNFFGDLTMETNAFDRGIAFVTMNGGNINISNTATRIDGMLVADGTINSAYDFTPGDDQGILYSTYFGGSGAESTGGIAFDENDNTYITGNTDSPNFPTQALNGPIIPRGPTGGTDIFVSKFDPNGNLIWSVLFGGSSNELAGELDINNRTNELIVVGVTFSSDFPIVGASSYDKTFAGPPRDGFVAKLSTDTGTLIWSTFLGAAGENGILKVKFASATSNNDILFCGATTAATFPTTVGAFDRTHNGSYDTTTGRLSNNGQSLIWATYLGGSDADICEGFDIDAFDNLYIGGRTTDGATDYPTTANAYDTTFNGVMDAFITIMSPTGAMLYSTFLGGAGSDDGNALKINPTDGDVYSAGNTESANFPTTAGAYDQIHNPSGELDGYLTRLDPELNTLDDGVNDMVWSTFYGGNEVESNFGIDIEMSEHVVITGRTESTDFPITPDAYQLTHGGGVSDAYYIMFHKDGDSLIYSTYLGGNGYDGEQTEVEYNPNRGALYIDGMTSSNNFPIEGDAFQPTFGGVQDSYMFRLAINGFHLKINGGMLGKTGINFGGRLSPSPLDLPAESIYSNIFLYVSPPPGVSSKKIIWNEIQ